MHVLLCYNLKRTCIKYFYTSSNRQKGGKVEVESVQPTHGEVAELIERLNQFGQMYYQAENWTEKIAADQQFYLLYRWFREHAISLSYNESNDTWTVSVHKQIKFP